jgi:hypothetical protein
MPLVFGLIADENSFCVPFAQHVQVERVMINVRSKSSDLEKCAASHPMEDLAVPIQAAVLPRTCIS